MDKESLTMTKIAALPRILEAAQLLSRLNLISEKPNELVKNFVNDNPDINEMLNKTK